MHNTPNPASKDVDKTLPPKTSLYALVLIGQGLFLHPTFTPREKLVDKNLVQP